MTVLRVLIGGVLFGLTVFSTVANAGPTVTVTVKNIGVEDAVYTVVTANEASTKQNASPTPEVTVRGGTLTTYRVQSKVSPDANAAMVRYVMGRKVCQFSTTYTLGVGSGGVRVPKWNKTATPSAGAVCTANITSFDATTREWNVEFTMK
ncbi:hypothetical protein [Pseudomonas fontis]|uniref:Uncharacterized protein n=1 Tax=Pseudomonas fontis TaxID=2942633 RepID=A0ABT5NVA1_9PSED|nr:hypothetical protein [Pseudomonas fontis]MDD0974181.1 hypothetical protein [Pseudomonas fontis]MDD0992061.1 hypothetical protein [Pseudomonas fontis]